MAVLACLPYLAKNCAVFALRLPRLAIIIIIIIIIIILGGS
jgi:hypothetical protein